ncbi:LuxR family transcriptional regulator [Bradyrhizobium sp. 76]|nr:LuxR family transcriptional regulator [Bradyrhizobium sp. 76]
MHRVFQEFVDRLIESTEPDAVRQSMADVAAALDLSCFAYLALSQKRGGIPELISTYPSSWTAHYLGRRYERFDPVISRAIRHTDPFRWSLGLGPRLRSESELELFEEAARYGIRYGITFPIHDNKGVIAALTFATDEPRIDFERSIKKHAPLLHLLAILFHAHAQQLLASDRDVGGTLLSPRELQRLEWYARGKSAWEIGNILGISPRTVGFHRDNARAKLGVRTIGQAIVLLTRSKPRR